MSLLRSVLVMAFVFSSMGAYAKSANVKKPAVQTVDFVDLTRYMGKWYEIATIPQSFQKDCIGDVTANYRILRDGKVEVINSCATEKGDRKVGLGRAKVLDSDSNAKLKVTFVKLVDWIFAFGGQYWVIDLEQNYNYAVVGHPTREYGWILARTPSLPLADLELIAGNLEAQGYDTCQFLTTPQMGGAVQKQRLCDVVNR